MASARKNRAPARSLSGIKTMAGLLDGRRARTSAGALLELSALANERERLRQELERWQRRHGEIQSRLAEIAAKEQRLQKYLTTPELLLRPSTNPCLAEDSPIRTTELPRNVITRELEY